jgi:hypothetical protein
MVTGRERSPDARSVAATLDTIKSEWAVPKSEIALGNIQIPAVLACSGYLTLAELRAQLAKDAGF